jgi:hypothetical protein
MGNQIHCHVIDDTYAARVSNLYMYDAVRYWTVLMLYLIDKI